MKVNIHPHAAARMSERGATEQEIIDVGKSLKAKVEAAEAF